MRLTTFCIVKVTRDDRGAIIDRRMVAIANDRGIVDAMVRDLKQSGNISYERAIYEAEAWTPERAN